MPNQKYFDKLREQFPPETDELRDSQEKLSYVFSVSDGYTGVSNAADGRIVLCDGTDNLTAHADLHWDRANNKLGIGETSPLGLLHVKTADNGIGSVNSYADELVLENNGAAGMTILSGSSWPGRLVFGDASDSLVSMLEYDHSSNKMQFYVNNAYAMYIDSSQNVGINDSTPSYKLDVNGTVRATEIISANKGIAFPSTQVASADANTLDDYEEGTWTPELRDSSGNVLAAGNHSYQNGRYTKIGNVVYITCRVGIDTTYSPMGAGNALRLWGLPFIHESTTAHNSAYVGYGSSLSLAAAGYSVSGYFQTNNYYINLRLWDSVAGNSNLLVSEMGISGNIMLSATYRTT